MRILRPLWGSILSWLAVVVGQASAQVTVEVVLDQEQFLRDESLPVEVRVTNRSGQDLQLGQADWLTFSIERKDGRYVPQTGRVPVGDAFTLESSQVAKRRLDLMPYFELSEPGSYQVTARVTIGQWNQEVVSSPKPFDIIRGLRIWQQDVGVPAVSGAPEAPEVRRYVLVQAHTFKRLMLYLRLTDLTDLKVHRMVVLGQLVSFSQPEAQVDKQSNLHVLFQTGARAFLYHMISPRGNVLIRETHDYIGSRPVLASDKAGKIIVSGGQRRPTSSDIPRSPPEAPTATPATPTP